MTVGAILAFSAGQDIAAAAIESYGDVVGAWHNFLATRSQGRPFVLIGHSQGSLHLIQLIAREIETKPGRRQRMKLAILPGFNVLVPAGQIGRRRFQDHAAVLETGRNRLRHRLDQLPRE